MNFTNGWYALYVKSRWEKKVYESLKDISLESFLPQIKTIRQWSDREKTILKPLFPSYVFVNINSSLEFHKALSVNGACAYIRFGKEYARVTKKEIEKIKILLGNFDAIELAPNNLEIGEKRNISFGILSGYECEILNFKGKDKVVVRIESLKQNIVAEFNSSYLKETI